MTTDLEQLELAGVLRKKSGTLHRARDAVREACDVTPSNGLEAAASEMRDGSELVLCLARLLEGKSIHDAFGAPGDWGYHNDVGKALYRLYSANGGKSAVQGAQP